MIKENKLKCDNCEKEFILSKLEVEKLKNRIERTYFICPNCNSKFTAYYTDPQVRKNIIEINRLTILIKASKVKDKNYFKKYEKMSNLIEFNKKRMQQLRAKYE